jgi:hypothetical protein
LVGAGGASRSLGDSNVEPLVVSKDYEQEMRDAIGELLLQIAAGEISAEDAQREVDVSNALIELVRIAIEVGVPWPLEERMRQAATLIAKWPEACRRAGVGAIPMPDHMIRAITSFVGRTS